MKTITRRSFLMLACFYGLTIDGSAGDHLIGTTTTTIGGTLYGGGADAGYCMVVQADGKIILIGSANDNGGRVIALARYNTDGTLDTTFNSTGIVKTDPVTSSIPYAACQQPDGKIVVVGETGYGGVILRYNADGSLDTSFNTKGWLTITETGWHSGRGVAVQSDGKIVVAMEYADGGNAHWLALLRCTANGALDTGFGISGTGRVFIPTSTMESFNSTSSAVAVLPNGKIMLLGQGNIRFQTNDFELARFNSDGTWDTTFGGGVLSTDFGNSDDQALSMAVQSDGKIVAAGTSSGNFAVARYNADGSLDTTFNGTGKAIADFGSNSDYGSAMVLQANGKIVMAGGTTSSGIGKVAVARWNTDGTLDTGFGGGNGMLTTTLGSNAAGTCIALQADGNFAVGGYAYPGSTADYLLARYSTNPLSPLETWRAAHYSLQSNAGVAADTADPYHKRIPNLTAYAFGLEPVVASPDQLPQPQITGANSIITFTQPSNVSGITYGAEWSTTLNVGDWHAISDTGTGNVHTFSVPISNKVRLFMRLKISNP